MASDLEDIGSAAEAAAARIRRRYPTREPDPRALAASQGKVTFGDFFGDPQAEATSLFYGGDYNPRSVLLSSLGVVGAPAAVGGVPLGALGSGVGKGIRAYHSSPHDFERFDISKIGLGQGAQSYGHGLYFAENPAVSGRGGQYWKEFAGHFDPQTAEGYALAKLREADMSRSKAATAASKEAERFRQMASGEGVNWEFMSPSDVRTWENQSNNFLKRAEREQAAADLLRNKKEIVGPRTYEVNINAAPEHFLDWDKPLAAQPNVLENVHRAEQNLPMGEKIPFEQWTKEARSIIKLPGQFWAPRTPAGTATYAEAGIPGIRYLDQGSRSAGAGSSNYVVFNDKLIDILRKYALAGVAPPAALTAAAQYQEPQ